MTLLLAESLRIARATGALKARDMERVTVDTTVQPKNLTHPTDTKLMHKAIVVLGALARKPRRGSCASPMSGSPSGPRSWPGAPLTPSSGSDIAGSSSCLTHPPGPADPRYPAQNRG
jgi:hypothetical protein